MKSDELEQIIKSCLDNFYQRRLKKLDDLKLRDTLRKKNPYLYRAIGVKCINEIVTKLLEAYMSSSEETIFGDAFFEPLVKAICCGTAAGGAGVDVVVETDDEYTVISVKSGPNWGNSSQMSKIQQDFMTARNVFANKKLKKHFRALLGHCYGRKNSEPDNKRLYYVRSGQLFWEELTGDPDFYLEIIRLMGKYPDDQKDAYDDAWIRAIHRFTKEILNDFATEKLYIDWEKLLKYNSGSD